MLFYLRYTIFNLILLVKNLLLSPFSRLARHRLSNTLTTLQYPFFGNNFVELSTVLQHEELSVHLTPVKAREHNITPFELLSIAAILKDSACNTVFEIGTYDGRTTRALALNLLNEQGKVFTLNLPPSTEEVSLETSKVDIALSGKVHSGERFLNTEQKKQIVQLWGDSAVFDFAKYHNGIDLIFIDGAHSEKYVETDTRNAMLMIKKAGGIIIWHDAHRYGVVKYLKQCINQHNWPIYFLKETSLAVAFVRDTNIINFHSFITKPI